MAKRRFDDNGGGAFPMFAGKDGIPQRGISVRMYVALQALPQVMAKHYGGDDNHNGPDAEWIAQEAFKIADAMIAQETKP